MENFQDNLKKLIELMGFGDFSVSRDENNGRFLVFISDGGEDFSKSLSSFVAGLDHLVRLMNKKSDEPMAYFVDVNNYRKERECLILELARGAARKAATTKEGVALPAMNAYERRLIHLELAGRVDVKTESVGEGRGRCVVVCPA